MPTTACAICLRPLPRTACHEPFRHCAGLRRQDDRRVCRDSGVDTGTFLTVVNTHIDGEAPDPGAVSVGALVGYLRNSHDYFLDFRLPGIRRKLIEAIDCSRNDVAFAILRFFDEYVAEVHKHMDYEERKVFPYVEALLAGERPEGLFDRRFRRHHDQVEAKLAELKRIIIRYYPREAPTS